MWKLYEFSPELLQLPAHHVLLPTLNSTLSILHTEAMVISLKCIRLSQNLAWPPHLSSSKDKRPDDGLKMTIG